MLPQSPLNILNVDIISMTKLHERPALLQPWKYLLDLDWQCVRDGPLRERRRICVGDAGIANFGDGSGDEFVGVEKGEAKEEVEFYGEDVVEEKYNVFGTSVYVSRFLVACLCSLVSSEPWRQEQSSDASSPGLQW